MHALQLNPRVLLWLLGGCLRGSLCGFSRMVCVWARKHVHAAERAPYLDGVLDVYGGVDHRDGPLGRRQLYLSLRHTLQCLELVAPQQVHQLLAMRLTNLPTRTIQHWHRYQFYWEAANASVVTYCCTTTLLCASAAVIDVTVT